MLVPQLLVLVLAALALTIVADRRGLQPPLVLAVAGIAVSFVPGLPRLEVDGELILSVVLPPLLFSTTTDFSWRSFRRRWRSITNLGVLLVVVTTVVVGFVAAAAVPWITLPTALVLAAVVSPPDAVTAVAIGGRLGLPSRVLTTLKGESLVNDAAALTLFSVTVAHVTGTRTFIDSSVLFFAYGAAVGIGVGYVLARLAHLVRTRIENPTIMTAFAVLLPFTAYAVAEELSASGVLAVVAAGFTLSRRSTTAVYATRLAERQAWNLLDVLLEAFVFAYLGLQVRFLVEDAVAGGSRAWSLLGAGLVVLAAVVAVRAGWILGGGVVMRNLLHGRLSPGGRHFSVREDAVLAWTGMRGVVTLAAAAGIPETLGDGTPFPHRADLQVLAFVVAVGTLLLQGATLPALIRRLGVDAADEQGFRARQRSLARAVVTDSTREVLSRAGREAASPLEERMVKAVLTRVERQVALRAEETEESEAAVQGRAVALRATQVRQEVITAQRRALLAAQEDGRLVDEVVAEHLEQLDLDEAALAHRGRPRL